ncbi:7435_t:CDS:2, partial [Gigaspora margarita]
MDNQETDNMSIEIKPRTKSYIDSAIQAATISMMQQMQQFITQQAETQREWNLEDNQQRIANSINSNRAGQGNFPSTPVINSLLLASGTENQGTKLMDSLEIVSYRAM